MHVRTGLCLKVKMETLLWGADAYRGDLLEHRRRVWRGAKERITRRRGGKIKTGGGEGWVIETKADEGRVECVPSDKQEHGSSLRGAPGEH